MQMRKKGHRNPFIAWEPVRELDPSILQNKYSNAHDELTPIIRGYEFM